MVNYSLIGTVVDLITNWMEARYGSAMSFNQTYAGAMNWYENTDITDPKELATCVIHYGVQYKPVDYGEVKMLTDQYFNINERW